MSYIFLGKRNLLGSNAANTAGIWRAEDITQMRYYDFIGAVRQEIVVETFANTTTWTAPTGVTEVEYLIVAGGGGGGGTAGGGGGAGGFRTGCLLYTSTLPTILRV